MMRGDPEKIVVGDPELRRTHLQILVPLDARSVDQSPALGEDCIGGDRGKPGEHHPERLLILRPTKEIVTVVLVAGERVLKWGHIQAPVSYPDPLILVIRELPPAHQRWASRRHRCPGQPTEGTGPKRLGL